MCYNVAQISLISHQYLTSWEGEYTEFWWSLWCLTIYMSLVFPDTFPYPAPHHLKTKLK